MVQVDMRKVTIYCQCDSEALRIEPDLFDDVCDGTCISLWERGCGDKKTSLKRKWHFIWHIIKYGTPYGDQVIIDKVGRKMLIEALQAYDTIDSGITITNTDTSNSDNIIGV